MNTRFTKTVLAASVALAALISAEAASAQPLRHQAAPKPTIPKAIRTTDSGRALP
jgi:hypothetical protein